MGELTPLEKSGRLSISIDWKRLYMLCCAFTVWERLCGLCDCVHATKGTDFAGLVSGKVHGFMDPILVQYLLFILVALLIIGAVMSLNRWLSQRGTPGSGSPHTWTRFDTRRSQAREEMRASPTLADEENEEEAELHVRARQNGHHANNHKPLI